MARTPLARRLQETVSAIAEARQRDISVEQVVEERTTRRELLRPGRIGGRCGRGGHVDRPPGQGGVRGETGEHAASDLLAALK